LITFQRLKVLVLKFESLLISSSSSSTSATVARVLEYLLECSTELHVEDGVDDWVEEAVHVAEPDEEGEEHRVNLADDADVKQVVADTHSVNNVDCEERNPAQQEHTCNQQPT